MWGKKKIERMKKLKNKKVMWKKSNNGTKKKKQLWVREKEKERIETD